MRATLDCCERAASGHAAAETATIFMNSRRLIAAPEAQTGHRTDLPFSLEGVDYRHDVRFGSKADIRAANIMSALPPRKRTFSVQTPMSAKGHVWTAPGWQELSSRCSTLVGAAMCSACSCGTHDRWP